MSVDQLEAAGDLLGSVLPDLVFVGGAVVPLLLTDPAAVVPRTTKDVDAIDVGALTLDATYRREEQLRSLGFRHVPELIGRWEHAGTGVLLDVMPPRETGLSPTNPWYPRAIEHAVKHTLPTGRHIRVIDAVSFIATKLVAYASRGLHDTIASVDLEDILTVISGREELADEIAASDAEIQSFISSSLSRVTNHTGFDSALASAAGPSAVDQQRIPVLSERISQICGTG